MAERLAKSARQRASKKATVRIPFEEAARGVEKEIAILNYVTCETCPDWGQVEKRDQDLLHLPR